MKKIILKNLILILLIMQVITGCQKNAGSKEIMTDKIDDEDLAERDEDFYEEPFEVNFEHYPVASIDLKEQIPTVFIEVPLVRQSTGYSCGVACTQSILRYSGYDFDVREDNLISALGANDQIGTRYEKIVEFLNTESHYSDSTQDGNANRIMAEAKFNLTIDELCDYLDQRKPVICAIQAWAYLTASEYQEEYESGHYVIAIGYDDKNIYFMDPSTSGNYTYIPKDEFIARWHDIDGEEIINNFGIIISMEANYDKDFIYKLE